MYIMTEFRKNLVRMWDSIRKSNKGATRCMSVCCDDCPLDGTVCNITETMTVFNAEAAIEIVTQWAKEHPVVTYKQKYVETFGVKPLNTDSDYICPRNLGFHDYMNGCECMDVTCEECAKDFWHSEYKEPKKEGE